MAVAVAMPRSCSSDMTLSLGTSICLGCGSKKQKKKKIRNGVSRIKSEEEPALT